MKLMESGMITLHNTTQGREYITPDQIEREVSPPSLLILSCLDFSVTL